MKKISETRFLDTSDEYRVRLRKTLTLNDGIVFFHESAPKENQFITVSLYPDGTLDVGIFLKKLSKEIKKGIKK